MKKAKFLIPYILLILLSGAAALNYKLFVFPNSFAPAGVDGICTIMQHLTQVNIGYLSLAINLPLMVLGFFGISRDFILKTTVYTLAFSAFSVLFGALDLSLFLYHTDSGSSVVLAPIVAGVLRGLIYVGTLRLGGSSGGIDILSALIKRRNPQYSMMSILFCLNVSIAVGAYLAYGFSAEPAICSILYSYVTTTVYRSVETKSGKRIKLEILTSESERLQREIQGRLGSSCAVSVISGGQADGAPDMVVCVLSQKQRPEIEALLASFEDISVFKSVVEIPKMGNEWENTAHQVKKSIQHDEKSLCP